MIIISVGNRCADSDFCGNGDTTSGFVDENNVFKERRAFI